MPQKILTSEGYKNIEDITIGDEILAYDVFTGNIIYNNLLDKTLWDSEIKEFTGKFYRINGKWDMYEEQSIWRNNNEVVHARELQIGDIIFDDNNLNVTVISITPVTKSSWWRLHISGDASFISDGVTLHNASRFWVGGTGTWDNVTTTHWSATTGGAGGASVPGSADLVNLDGASGGGTVTLNYSLTVGGVTGGTHTGTFVVGANTLTMAGSSRFSYTGTGTRTLDLTNSTIGIVGQAGGGWDCTVVTNMTLISTGSTITGSGGLQNSSFIGGGLSYGTFTATTGGGASTINGSNTFTNLNLTVSASGRWQMIQGQTQTVTVMFTALGTTSTNFGAIVVTNSGGVMTRGVTATISAFAVTLTNVIFQDIVGSGLAVWTGTQVGDGGGNTGITFTIATTRYWVGGTGSYNSTTKWSATSGGASGASIPLPQDTVVFDANSVTTAGQVLTFNHSHYPTIDFTNILNSPTITNTLTNGVTYYLGNIILKSGLTINGANSFIMSGIANQSITSNGVAFANTNTNFVQINNSGSATVSLLDDLSGPSTGALNLLIGKFDANNKNITCGLFTSSNTQVRVLTMGSGTWNLTGSGTTLWNTGNVTNLTINANTSTIVCSYSGATGTRGISAGGKVLYNLSITAGTDTFNFDSSYNNINFTGFSGIWGSGGATNANFAGNLTLSSTMTVSNTVLSLTANGTSGTQTITSAGQTIPKNLVINTTAGVTVQLGDNLSIATGNNITLTQGIINGNGFNLTTPSFISSNANVRGIVIGSGTWNLTGTGTVWDTSTSTNLTVTAGGTIKITDTSISANTFAGGSKTYGNIWFARGTSTGNNIITGSNNFADIKDDGTVAHSFLLTAGTTTGFTSWSVDGTSGQLITLDSTTVATHTLKNNGSTPVIAYYLNIKNSIAT